MLSLVMKETMSGYIELNDLERREPFEFSIRIFFKNRLNPLAPQPFRGTFTLAGRRYTGEVSGMITLKLSGPRYALDLDFPGLGPVHMEGEKTYSLDGLVESLITCPLIVSRAGKILGFSEVAYRNSILCFPFQALRLARQETVWEG
ncbi:hypothetical protein HDN1F_36110 [gamma proteobacterium HdN1]|nr:hypothetical protein HDN1F_36110 [gamma proteobacterium HdN1]